MITNQQLMICRESPLIKATKYHILFIIIWSGLSGCLDKYQPPKVSEAPALLVVDGYLNSTDGSATVKLSRSISLASSEEPPAEHSASVEIQVENGGSYDLEELDSGTYTIQNLVVNANSKYRLSVRTNDGHEYLSDYVSIRQSPEIDSLTWEEGPDGLYINVNSHDVSGNTRYYRWDFVETWEYWSPVISGYTIKDRIIVPRSNDEYTYQCWRTLPSTKIIVATTERLTEDRVSQFHINYIPRGDYRISVVYSPLVTQRSISADEYAFWDQLQKTTETIGGLFDSQPGQVLGNIYPVNSSDIALGYFTAGSATSKRFFIKRYDLPQRLQYQPFVSGCEADTVCARPPYKPTCAFFTDQLSGNEYIGSPIYSQASEPVAYTLSSRSCTDCRSRGGVLQKPEFWP